MRYTQAFDGEWIRPKHRGYYMKCCDCGLVHRLDFRVTKRVNKTHAVEASPAHRVEFRAYRVRSRRKQPSTTKVRI